MKSTIPLLFCLAVTTVNAQNIDIAFFKSKAQPGKSKMRSITHTPSRAENYSWDSNDWQMETKEFFTYDAQGNITERIYKTAQDENVSKETSTYDSNGNQTSHIYQYWDGIDWINSDKNIYLYLSNLHVKSIRLNWANGWDTIEQVVKEYDAQNTLILEQGLLNNQGSWQVSYGYKFIPQYDSQMRKISEVRQEYILNGNSWMNLNKDSIVWNTSDTWAEYYQADWVAGQWEPEYRVVDLQWHNFVLMEPLSYKLQLYNNNTYNDYNWTTAVYETNGSYVATTQVYIGNGWQNLSRNTHTLDQNGNDLLNKSEYWQNNNWLVDYMDASLHQYDGNNNRIRTVFQIWENSSQSLINGWRSDYFFETTSHSNDVGSGLILFPNPASEKLFITTTGLTSDILLVDVTGRIIAKQKASSATIMFDLTKLSGGIYYVTSGVNVKARFIVLK